MNPLASNSTVPARKLINFSEFQKEYSLAEQLPYWDFVGDTLVLADGTLAKAFRLKGIDIETWESERINQWCLNLRASLNCLPDNLELSFCWEMSEVEELLIERHQELLHKDCDKNIRWLGTDRVAQLKLSRSNNLLLQSNLVLVVYQRFSEKKEPLSFFKEFFRPPKQFKSMAKDVFDKSLETLNQNCEAIVRQLNGQGIGVTALTAKELLDKIYHYLNPKRAKDLRYPQINTEYRAEEFSSEEKAIVPELTSPSLREQMVFSDLILDFDFFYLDGLYHRVISLKTLPEFTYASFVNHLSDLAFPFEFQLHLKVPEQSQELASLHSRRRMAHSMSAAQVGKVTDLESEAKLHSTEALLRELIETGEKIFYFQFCFILKSKNKAELQMQTKAVLSKIRELNGAEGMAETVGALKVWKTLLPLGNTLMVRPKRVKTSNLVDFLPLYQPYEGSNLPVCLFQNRNNGLVSYNPFDPSLPNYNTLVTGSSGAGKSFLNNLILLQYMGQKPLVYIIDIGGSYKKLCEFLGGQYIEVSPPRDDQSPFLTINPFHLADGQQMPSAQKTKFLLSFLETILGENNKLGKLERGLLEEVINDLYESKKLTKETPHLSDLTQILSKSTEVILRNFTKLLYPWLNPRPYGKMLDGDQALNLNSELVVFDLKGLSSYPDLQSAMILILTDFILGQVESKQHLNRPKQIIMDECWEHLKSPAASLFMEYCVRTLRKTGSGITFITQGLEEIMQSPIGAAIISNTASKFILPQRGNLDPIRQILRLNEKEMALISSLHQNKGQYSEAFMLANENRAVVRLAPTKAEYWLATSDAQDNKRLSELRNQHPEKQFSEVLNLI